MQGERKRLFSQQLFKMKPCFVDVAFVMIFHFFMIVKARSLKQWATTHINQKSSQQTDRKSVV